MRRQITPRAAWLAALALFVGGSAAETYGPVQTETLTEIAIKLRPQQFATSTCQTALAIYWGNPGAFAGSIHRLKPGAVLKLPSREEIESVDGDLARKLYSDPSFEFPAQRPAMMTAAGTSTVSPPPAPPVATKPVTPPPPPAAKPPAVAPAAPAAATATFEAVPAATKKPAAVAPVAAKPALKPAPAPAVSATAAAPEPVPATEEKIYADSDGEPVTERRRPGEPGESRPAVTPPTFNPNRETELLPVAPPPQAWNPEAWVKAPVPDRWRILNSLGLVPQRWYDPYNQNTFKGDKPVRNGDEFLILSAIFDGIAEPRKFPQPVGGQSTTDPGSVGIFGGFDNTLYNANIILSAVYLKGDTTFRPPDWEYHLLPVISFNYARAEESRVLDVDPRDGTSRSDAFVGLQELFADYHLRNVSDRFDFDSFRIGIQPFSSDFRGFLFQDNQLMLRYFGTRDNNRWQFNLAYLRRLEKDTNSGLNDISQPLRDDDTYIANVYRQDFPVLGFTSQATVAHNRNREDGNERFFNTNGFIERPASLGLETPRRYEVTYLGYNGDGHFGRLNLTVSGYLALGEEDQGVFVDGKRDIAAAFGAFEASIDQDWIRWRLSAMYQSGEDDPFDDEANGFDAIFENPTFAGADTSFWFRQAVPLIGGGIVNLSQRNGLLNNLRTSKEHGQSNFANPGLVLAGIGNDMDLMPQVRLSTNFNHLWFDDTTTLEVARGQTPIDDEIGWDLSAALIWRPFFQQNVVFRLSGAYLLPGDGFKDLFPDQDGYSVLGNLILTY
ncbi:MAG: FimV/HubP family polar landmark protein [Panacagrimonas sp.]